MKKKTSTQLLVTISSSLAAGLAIGAANAETNPFSLTELSKGYLQTAEADKEPGKNKMKDGACGEGKCGAGMMPGNEEKTVEGKCAGSKPMPTEAKCGEGKCGEGKCGGQKGEKKGE